VILLSEVYLIMLSRLVNLGGLLTTNLLSMPTWHIFELVILALIFIDDLWNGTGNTGSLDGRWHHILSISGISVQLHFGIGGGLMVFLLLDQIVDYCADPRLFWAVFFLLRVIGDNVLIGIAVKQALNEMSSTMAIWLVLVVIWWVFSVLFHASWVWGASSRGDSSAKTQAPREQTVVPAGKRSYRL
jgi:hypothetical protein